MKDIDWVYNWEEEDNDLIKNKIINDIKRLGEINAAANDMISIDDGLIYERKVIVDFLKTNDVIILNNEIDPGGFSFIGKKIIEYRNLYLTSYNNW